MKKKIEIISLLIGLLFVLSFHFLDYQKAVLWSGEPSFHIQLQLDIIRDLMINKADGLINFISQFGRVYYKFPKQGYDVLSILYTYVIIHDSPPNLIEHKIAITQLQLFFFIFCCFVIFIFLFRKFGLRASLLCLILFTTDIYNIVYSTFPRQNILGHLFSTFVVFYYLYQRSADNHFKSDLALLLGILVSIGSLFHYSVLEIIIIIVTTELFLIFYEKINFFKALNRILIFLASIVAVWVAGDIFFYFCLHAGLIEYGTNYPILEGMVRTLENTTIYKKPSWKIEGGSATFSLKYLFQIANPWLLIFSLIGILKLWKKTNKDKKFCLMISVGVILFFLCGMRFFATARSLEHYMPYFLILSSFGILEVLNILKKKINYISQITIVIMITIIATQIPRIINSKTAIRGQYDALIFTKNLEKKLYYVGRVDEVYLSAAAIDIIEINKKNYRQLCREKPLSKYLLTSRAIPIKKTPITSDYKKFIDVLRNTKPIKVFPNYNSLTLYNFEFPLKKDVFDKNDPLATTIRLYNFNEIKNRLC